MGFRVTLTLRVARLELNIGIGVYSLPGVLALALLRPLAIFFGVAITIPSLAVGVRRLHDTDRTGWWMLLKLIPVIGDIILIVWFCHRGTEGSNRFGSA